MDARREGCGEMDRLTCEIPCVGSCEKMAKRKEEAGGIGVKKQNENSYRSRTSQAPTWVGVPGQTRKKKWGRTCKQKPRTCVRHMSTDNEPHSLEQMGHQKTSYPPTPVPSTLIPEIGKWQFSFIQQTKILTSLCPIPAHSVLFVPNHGLN